MMPEPSHDALLNLVPAGPAWRVDWGAIRALWPALDALDTCPQDPLHHAEGDVGTHTRMVVDALVADDTWRALCVDDRAQLFWAAVLHDIGKPATTRREEDGRISARGHSRVGAAMARHGLWHLHAPYAWREGLCGIIAAHQLPFWLIERDDPQRLAIRTSWRCRPDHLCLHARADAVGRVCADQAAILDNVDLARVDFEEATCLTGPFAFANDESRVAFFDREDRDPSYAAHEDYRCTVTLMSGLPGTGKDTWIAANRPDLPVVSLDAIRDETGASPTGAQGAVVQAAAERAREHLRARRDFVWNATNVTRQMRARVLRLLRAYGARIEIVYLEAPPDRLKRQNAARDASVPEAVVDRLARRLEPPEPWEAHAVTWVVER
ncbi:MAG: AAA family ATPase [Pseudomonadota bacterium]